MLLYWFIGCTPLYKHIVSSALLFALAFEWKCDNLNATRFLKNMFITLFVLSYIYIVRVERLVVLSVGVQLDTQRTLDMGFANQPPWSLYSLCVCVCVCVCCVCLFTRAIPNSFGFYKNMRFVSPDPDLLNFRTPLSRFGYERDALPPGSAQSWTQKASRGHVAIERCASTYIENNPHLDCLLF